MLLFVIRSDFEILQAYQIQKKFPEIVPKRPKT